MKRDVQVVGRKVVVRAKPGDAVAKVRRMNFAEQVASGKRLTDEQRDVAIVALLQINGVIGA